LGVNVRWNRRTTLNAHSMSKKITAAAVLLLVEAQAVGLDDQIQRYLGFSRYRPAITTGQLLTYTSVLEAA
jgi:CubicO group peptidase (beta-lactamase class C family)